MSYGPACYVRPYYARFLLLTKGPKQMYTRKYFYALAGVAHQQASLLFTWPVGEKHQLRREQLVKNTNCGEKLIGLRTYGTRNLSISAFYQWMVPDGTYTTSLFVTGCRNMLLDIKSCFALLPLQVFFTGKHPRGILIGKLISW